MAGSGPHAPSGTDRAAGLRRPPHARVHRQFTYDGLHVEELEWRLPYGPPTRALFLKPAGAHGPLPAVLALHDHGGNHYFGRRKIARTSDRPHPDMVRHQELAYGGVGWANQIARRGYAVLVHDAFSFASRRVLAADLPGYAVHSITGRVSRIADVDPTEWHGMDTSAWTVSEQEPAEEIEAYNRFAGPLENLIAKSLFCAGTTWPGVFSVEDQRALDYLCARDDVDPNRVGCGGLSGGGLRTVFLAGLDDRIRCAVCVGFMTTWRDFLLNKCFVHTWMAYVPLLPRELDFPDILSLRAPLPTMVLNTRQDELYTRAEMQAADETLRAVYRKAMGICRCRTRRSPGSTAARGLKRCRVSRHTSVVLRWSPQVRSADAGRGVRLVRPLAQVQPEAGSRQSARAAHRRVRGTRQSGTRA